MKRFSLLLLLALSFTACAVKYENHEARAFVIKTKTLRYADAGFMHTNKNALHLEILMAGHAAFSLDIGQKVCINRVCLAKKEFTTLYLNPDYPSDTLENIFFGNPIFDGKNRVETSKGFTQKIIKKDRYDIQYSNNNGTIRFKDTIAKILIKSRKI